ncbi:MAG: NAD(P)/FAD-dependent oxidoreductase [Chloroflexi bacterium]|nr:NAD(P)/FAD-dependent oxidoreductase [Chloroflexota bacterium]
MLKQVALGVALLGSAVTLARRLKRAKPVPALQPHTSETEAAYRKASHRILILGAGFGGLNTALELDRQLHGEVGTSILLADRNNDLLFAPLLWIVANGRANPSDVMVPVRAFQRGRRFHVLYAGVTAIELEDHLVTTTAGSRPYDYLVISLGSRTAVPDLPGLREHALLFHSPADALQLRNHLIEAIENAHQATDPAEREAWLTFVVGGGGDTGVELAATIYSYLVGGMFARYPWLAGAPIRVVVVGHASRLVPMGTLKASDAVRRTLEAEDIEVMTGVAVTGATDRAVLTEKGEIPCRTLFWAAGITAPDIVRSVPGSHAQNGALIVDDHLRLPDHPEVYVVGDVAWAFDAATHQPIPPTAQAAEHEAAYVGKAIAAAIRGEQSPPFHFKPLGHLALLGNYTGVAEVGPFTFTGPLAWIMWHGYYLWHVPSWRNRVHLLADWLLSWLTGPDTTKLPLNTAYPLPLPAR